MTRVEDDVTPIDVIPQKEHFERVVRGAELSGDGREGILDAVEAAIERLEDVVDGRRERVLESAAHAERCEHGARRLRAREDREEQGVRRVARLLPRVRRREEQLS